MKLTLHRYIFNEMWPTFLASLLIFTLVMVATKMLSITEWVINQGVHPVQVLKLIFYLLPNIALFALPAASLMAVLIAFLRLSGDNEIMALKTSGISLYQMLPPAIILCLIGYLTASIIAFVGVPWGNLSFKNLIFKVVKTKVDMGIRERIFFNIFNDVVFYVNSISPQNRIMKDVFVVDRRDKSVTNTIIAREGRLLMDPKSGIMTVYFTDGTIFIVEKEFENARRIEFKTYDLSIGLNDFMPSIASKRKLPKEMFIPELIHSLKVMPEGELKYNEMVIELLERFSIPLAVFLIGLIGIPLGTQIRSRSRSFGIALSLVIFLMYYMFFMGVKSLCETGVLRPALGMWVPDLFLAVCLIYLFHRVARERSINFLKRFSFMSILEKAGIYGKGAGWDMPDEPEFVSVSSGSEFKFTQSRLPFKTCPQGPDVISSDGEKYIGNIRLRRFHKRDCRWAEKIIPGNRLSFKSRQSALDKKYKPCSVCKP